MRKIVSFMIVLMALLGLSQCELIGYLTNPNLHQSALSGMKVQPGTMTPAFDSKTTGYDVTVASGVTSVTVTPTAKSPTATIVVQSGTTYEETVASGAASPPITLSVGSAIVYIVVTAEDRETTTSYHVYVHD
jgi:hypothetical protein